jgi:hypothetical protein
MKKVYVHFFIVLVLLLIAVGSRAQCSGNSILVSGRILSAKNPMDAYQWVKCPSLTDIPGAVGSHYYVTEEGDYALIVQTGSCRDTLGCVSISGLSIADPGNTDKIRIFPNPSGGDINITGSNLHGAAVLKITGVLGRTTFVREIDFDNGRVAVKTSLPKGNYYLQITDAEGRAMVAPLLIE